MRVWHIRSSSTVIQGTMVKYAICLLELKLLLEALPLLLPLSGVVDEGLVLPPTLLSVLLLPPSVLPAFWFDGIIDAIGVLPPSDVAVVLLPLSLLLLPPSLLLSSAAMTLMNRIFSSCRYMI
jgi:hypothetical protein